MVIIELITKEQKKLFDVLKATNSLSRSKALTEKGKKWCIKRKKQLLKEIKSITKDDK